MLFLARGISCGGRRGGRGCVVRRWRRGGLGRAFWGWDRSVVQDEDDLDIDITFSSCSFIDVWTTSVCFNPIELN